MSETAKQTAPTVAACAAIVSGCPLKVTEPTQAPMSPPEMRGHAARSAEARDCAQPQKHAWYPPSSAANPAADAAQWAMPKRTGCLTPTAVPRSLAASKSEGPK